MAQIPRADPGLVCPFHKQPMEEVCHKCPLWIQLRGRNPNTGQDLDQWGCSFSFLPMLLIENAQQTRGAAAATEDARNQIVNVFDRAAQTLISITSAGERAKLIDGGRQ